MAALSVEAALARILKGVTPLEAEPVSLLDANGRTLAADIPARLTQPPFAASAMDGYAVRKADVARLPATLAVIGESAAGLAFRGRLLPGQAVRIFTGAPIPEGADAIVIQENTHQTSTTITVHDGQPDADHIRPGGGDFLQGATLLRAGRVLDARALTLAAAGGYATLPVRRRPRVAILATGNELVAVGETPGPDQIISSNPVGLAAMVRAFGGEPILLGIAPDTTVEIADRLARAQAADVLVTTGGASVGDHDLVRPALESLGLRLEFWSLAMRPGKPMLFGCLGHQRVLGLPGNPVSALITARVFLCPLIAAHLGRAPGDPAGTTATLSSPLDANGPRQHYMRAHIDEAGDKPRTVTPLSDQDSSRLAPLAEANVLIVRPPHAPPVPAGQSVPILWIDF